MDLCRRFARTFEVKLMIIFFLVTENQKKLITEQLLRKEKLAKELKIEKGRLEAIKKEINAIQGPVYPIVSLEV